MVRMGGTENGEGQVCWEMVGVKGLKNSGSIVKPHKARVFSAKMTLMLTKRLS